MELLASLWENEYVQFSAILLGSFFLTNIVHFVLVVYGNKVASTVGIDTVKDLLKIVIGPLYIFILSIGASFAFQTLSALENYADLIQTAFNIFSIAIAAYVASRVLALLVSKWFKVSKQFEHTPQLVNRIVSVLVYAIAGLMILSYLNIEITPIVATMGLGGLAVGLALQNTLSNFFSGIHIISDRPVNVGDFIELEGGQVQGFVEDINWRSTRIRTFANTIIVIPNSKLAESIIVNDSLPRDEIGVYVKCGVSYNDDLEKVEKVAMEVARYVQENVKGGIKDFTPLVRFNEFGDSNINFTVIMHAERLVNRFLITHEFIKQLKKRFDEEGIEISFPRRTITIEGGEAPKKPKS